MRFVKDIEADIVVFDAYGTIFDVHSAVMRAGQALGLKAQAFSDLWRQKQLEYTWVRTLMGRYESFWALTEESLDYALATLAPAQKDLRAALLESYRHLAAYDDVRPVLENLRNNKVKTAILSNGDGTMLEDAVKAAGLEALFDGLISIEEIGLYKTAPDAYRLVKGAFGIEANLTLFISSNRWDVAGARLAGFHPLWINRAGRSDEYRDCPPDAILKNLGEIFLRGR
ncbi:MAG: haloacid dehalogenase type II [Alphaproteobacteria bacterium]|nr:haloacid dehalogenase type II [Alphaproteobacteria bacterium]